MKRTQSGDIVAVLAALVILGFIGAIVGWIIFSVNWSNQHRTQTITVNKSERVTDSDGKNSRYLIYAREGVFEDTDDWINKKFNSSDLYNQIQPGKTYSCDTVGWRDQFQSWYPNLISCTEVR